MFTKTVRFDLRHRRRQIAFARDSVSVEHTARFVTRDSHSNGFRNSSANQITHSRPAKVMHGQPCVARVVWLTRDFDDTTQLSSRASLHPLFTQVRCIEDLG